MASFKGHQFFNYFLLIIILTILFKYSFINILTIIFVIGYMVGTELITPDLDIKSTPSNRLSFLSWPYRLIFTHRGKSHTPITGFITRMIFFIVPALILLYLVGIIISLLYLVIFVIGIAIANYFHIMLDYFT